MIQKDWLSLNTDVERIILRQQTRFGKYLTTSYAGTIVDICENYLNAHIYIRVHSELHPPQSYETLSWNLKKNIET